MNRVPRKILWIVLFAGIVSIFGQVLLSRDLDNIVARHQEIMDQHVMSRKCISQISGMLYEHQAAVTNYLVMDKEDARMKQEEKLTQLETEIEELLLEFDDYVQTDRQEQLYHKVYSNYGSYRINAGRLLDFCKEGSEDMAIYYNNRILASYIEDINVDLQTLGDETIEEIKYARQEMGKAIQHSKWLEAGSISLVVILTVFSVVYSVKITTGLEHYRQELEWELETKTRALQEHNEKMIALQENIIIGMANLIENRDGDTGEHVKRTSFYVKILAKEAQSRGMYLDILTNDYIDRLSKAAPLHDVGKIGIPDRILNKPGRLSEEEFEIMKTHAPEGGRIIREIFENIEDRVYVDTAVEVAAYHHEKWDGSGYMAHLVGEAIPLSARIMAIADVFDALVSKRCYKKQMPLDDAFRIIEESAGSHFDPQLVKIFLSLRPQIEEFLEEK